MSTEFSPMLLLTINNSIGDQKKHLTIAMLCDLFQKETDFSPVEKYAVDIIQTEATESELSSFSKQFNIPKEKINHVFSLAVY